MKRTIPILVVSLTVASAAMLLNAQATQPAEQEKVVTDEGLTIITVERGEGAKDGDIVFVHYAGRLEDGTPFDSSYERGRPIDLVLGTKQVIAGWEMGIQGMQVGEKRQLIIPPLLAYGPEGRPPKIPQNATLVFDIELMGIQRR